MPNAPYIVCHFSKSSIRQWWEITAEPLSPVEIGPFLTEWVKHYWPKYSLSTVLQTAKAVLTKEQDIAATDPLLTPEILAILEPILLGSPLKMSVTTITISMDMMQELDAVMADKPIREQFDILEQIIGEATPLWRTHGLGVDFSEVFWVEDDQSPPAHYRPGVDRVVSTLAEYQHLTAQFSYQLAKAVFTLPADYFPILTRPEIFRYIYSAWEDLSRPAHTFEYSHFTHILEVKHFLNKAREKESLVLRLGPQIALDDLKYCHTDFLRCAKLKEVTFLLPNAQHATAEQRALVLQTMIDFAEQYHWRFSPIFF